jgi:nicotinate-nucleotide adenylyltransferase
VRLALFGGTFDPPHIGHLLAASDAVEALDLDVLVFVPNATQPLKGSGAGAPADRLAMVRLMAGDDPRFQVDPIEIERAGVSYTVDTLASYAETCPDAQRFLLIGADVLTSFAQWRAPDRVAALARVAVLVRGAEEAALDAGMLRVTTRRVDVSSTEIRERVRAGKCIHGFVPDAVAAYIATARLYV